MIDCLWISSYQETQDLSLLEKNEIKSIVSLGCHAAYSSNFHSYSCLTLQDSPESPILHVIEEVIPFLIEHITKKNSVLVHCVYGQSRSVVICVAYLISNGMEFEIALNHMKLCHPNICINPGFLTQLKIFSDKRKYSLQYEMILNQFPVKNILRIESNPRDQLMIECRDCRRKLVHLDDIIDLRHEEETLKGSIISFVDPFWSNYHSLHSSLSQPCNLPVNFVVCRPSQWMIDEGQITRIEKKEKQQNKKRRKDLLPCQSLHCPGCRKVIGRYRHKDDGGILVAGGYVLTHLYCLDQSSVIIPNEISELEELQNESEEDLAEVII